MCVCVCVCVSVQVRSSHESCSIKKLFLKTLQYSQKTPVLKSIFNNFIKETPAQMFPCHYCKIFKNNILKTICELTAASGVCDSRFTDYNTQIILNTFVFRKTVDKCVAFGCNSGYQSSSKCHGNLASFHFPFNKPDILQDFIRFVNRHDWKPTTNSVLCELPF